MNFGTIGSFVGHEVTHGIHTNLIFNSVLSHVLLKILFQMRLFQGFDDNGRQLDANGNFVNWWDNDTLIEFTERAQCFIDKV